MASGGGSGSVMVGPVRRHDAKIFIWMFSIEEIYLAENTTPIRISPMPASSNDPPDALVIAFATGDVVVTDLALAFGACHLRSDVECGLGADAVGDQIQVSHVLVSC